MTSTLHTGAKHVSSGTILNKDTQYKAVEAAIKAKLVRIALLVGRQRYDAAAVVCELVANDRAKLAKLRLEYAADSVGPLHNPPKPAEPQNRFINKRKAYKRWSDK